MRSAEESSNDNINSAIEVSSDDESDVKSKPSNKKLAKKAPLTGKTTTVVKAYRTEAKPQLGAEGPGKRPRNNAQSTMVDAISSIGSYFDPENIRGRQEAQYMQTHDRFFMEETRRLRMENDRLHQEVANQTRRADNAEFELRMHKMLNKKSRRRSPSSDSSNYQRRSHKRKSRHYSRSQSPSHRRSPSHTQSSRFTQSGYSRPDTSESYLIENLPGSSSSQVGRHSTSANPGILMRVTPKKNEAGHTIAYEMSPTKPGNL